jgi:amino-acid N-acetyltransferase
MLNVFQRPSLAQVRQLAVAADLPTDDLGSADLGHFFGAGTRDDVRGVVGLELLGDAALLRSLAVVAEARGAGYGRALVAAAERHAAGLGVRSVYLLTTTAADFFARMGYRRVERESAPAAVQGTREFAALCPASATCMVKQLGPG